MSKSARVLVAMPWREIRDLVGKLVDEGATEAEAVEAAAVVLDAALVFDASDPSGAVLEAVDGPILRVALTLVVRVAKQAAERRARRAPQ